MKLGLGGLKHLSNDCYGLDLEWDGWIIWVLQSLHRRSGYPRISITLALHGWIGSWLWERHHGSPFFFAFLVHR